MNIHDGLGWGRYFAMIAAVLFLAMAIPQAQAAENNQDSNGARILEAFDRQQVQRVQGDAISNHEKQVIMFAMGVPLAILLLITGGLGIANGIYGKQLFIAHMIFAGLTVTLALAHVIVGIVWFFPF